MGTLQRAPTIFAHFFVHRPLFCSLGLDSNEKDSLPSTSKTGGLICYASQRPTWREDLGGLCDPTTLGSYVPLQVNHALSSIVLRS